MGKAGEEKILLYLIAVEVSKHCPCHRLVLARCLDIHSWYYFFIKEPSWIEFGDRLLYYPETQELFQDRGPMLMYRALLDEVPSEYAVVLVEKLPYAEMYPNEGGGIVFEPPQGDNDG